jgi:hypothetical protein
MTINLAKLETDLASLKTVARVDPYGDLARGEDGRYAHDEGGDLIFLPVTTRPTAFLETDGGKPTGALIVSAEDGKRFANYYGEWEGEAPPFDPWVSPEIEAWAKAHGYEVDWRDPGSLILWPE